MSGWQPTVTDGPSRWQGKGGEGASAPAWVVNARNGNETFPSGIEEAMAMLNQPVFVFGSNLLGRHGRGAALDAVRWHGAIHEQGSGPQGGAYAIPTKDADLKVRPLSQVRDEVAKFIEHAQRNPDTTFQVTRVGCGLAGLNEDVVFEAFASAPRNCLLPWTWERRRNDKLAPRIIIAGSRAVGWSDGLKARIDRLLERMMTRGQVMPIVVSRCARGADAVGEHWAQLYGLPVIRLPAAWGVYGKAAWFLRNKTMSWASSHLVATWDGESHGTKHMIETANHDGLAARVMRWQSGATQ